VRPLYTAKQLPLNVQVFWGCLHGHSALSRASSRHSVIRRQGRLRESDADPGQGSAGLLGRPRDPRLPGLSSAKTRSIAIPRVEHEVGPNDRVRAGYVPRLVGVNRIAERAVFVPFGGRNIPQQAATRKQQAATRNVQRQKRLGYKQQQAASPGNTQQLDRTPAVNRRIAGSNPA